ncbi:MAG: GWxTD domain-containing protein [Bacteroidota bacterium]
MKKNFWLATILILLFSTIRLIPKDENPFFFDAICFKSSNSDTLSRIDIFVVVPYSTLSFFKSDSKYTAEYTLTYTLKDSNSSTLKSKSIIKRIEEKDQLETLGASAKFQESYHSFEVPEGKYIIEATVYDKNSNTTYTKRRTTNALNFSRFDFALSGIMFVSEIEEQNSEFKITPYLSDNLGNLDNIFIFLETYQKSPKYDSVDIVYQIVNPKNKDEYRSSRKTFSLKNNQQIFFPLVKPVSLKNGSYFLRVTALKPSRTSDSNFTPSEILSVSERAFEITPSISNQVLTNLDKSIRQLKYVAYQSDIDYINQAPDPEEKKKRFLEFWKKLDPTPSTEYNEAFEEYYERVYYANANFKSYIEGWQTDRGMVYIVLGPPATIQTQSDFYSNRNYEIWNYANRTFIFVDYSGFGDYRLYSPPTFNEKYSYR